MNITASAPVSFINLESDQTSPDKPAFGVAGWAKDDAAVLLYDKYDLWQVAPDGSGAKNLTNGASRRGPPSTRPAGSSGRPAGIRPDRRSGRRDRPRPNPLYFSLYGEWTKKSGYARLLPGGDLTRLIWLDRAVGGLAKAKNAEVYGYTLQDYDISPNRLRRRPRLERREEGRPRPTPSRKNSPGGEAS